MLTFEFWIQTHWYIALVMSLVTNLSVYLVAGYFIDTAVKISTKNSWLGTYIDERPLNKYQTRTEIKNGMIACGIFSLASLLTRELFIGVVPSSLITLVVEMLCFTLFYETYSYFVHRALHSQAFRKAHSVHHKSVRTTPWSSYNVHPFEASFIAMSAPLFMLLFPVHLSVIFSFHVLGILFTLIIHSNLKLNSNNIICQLFNRFTVYHSRHHSVGNKNFGFINSLWDTCFKTKYVSHKAKT